MAIPYVKQVWADADASKPLSAARMGVLEQAIFDLNYAPAVRAFHSTTQSLTNATVTALAMNSERFDQASNVADTMHDLVTNNTRLTCRYAGVYLIMANVSYAANATGNRLARIRHQGTATVASTLVPAAAGGSDTTDLSVSGPWVLAVNEYVEVFGYQTSGGALNVSTVELAMVRVG